MSLRRGILVWIIILLSCSNQSSEDFRRTVPENEKTISNDQTSEIPSVKSDISTSDDDKITDQTTETKKDDLAVKYLVFSFGQTVGYDQEIYLGYYQLNTDSTATFNAFIYRASSNSRWIVQNLYHPSAMGVDCGTTAPFTIAGYSAFVDYKGTWKIENADLVLTIAGVVHHWTQQSFDKDAFHFAKAFHLPSSSMVIGGKTYSNPVGFAFLTVNYPISSKTRGLTSFKSHYQGELWQNNTNSSETVWKNTATSFTPSVFNTYFSNMTSYVSDCSGGMKCQYSLSFNLAPYTTNLFYLNGGHDFNNNKCFDDRGHTQTWLGLTRKNNIDAIVFIEESQEDDGYPILSVGWYY